MATVTGFTAARMLAIENSAITGARLDADHLILIRHDLGELDVGSVRGPAGPTGPAGADIPIGGLVPFAGISSPSALYLICDGAAISRTTYATLFGIIGGLYGVGNGSTTFNIPDLRGRAPIGAGDGPVTSNRALGSTGGEENHTLSSGEMPAHSHTQNAHGHGISDHNHGVQDGGQFLEVGTPYGRGPSVGSGGPVVDQYEYTSGVAGGGVVQNAIATNQNAGGGGAHNIMQPYIALNYLIRVQ